MPLFNGEFLFTPATRERSVQMFLEGVEYGEKPVYIICFDFTAQTQLFYYGRVLLFKTFSSVYSDYKCTSICAENPANDCGKYVFKMFFVIFNLYEKLFCEYWESFRNV